MWNNVTIRESWLHNTASFGGDTTARQVIRLSRRYISGKVLDVGAGSGALLDLLPYAFGVDIVPRHKQCQQGSIDSLPFDDNSFSTVFCTDVLEHLPSEVLARGMREVCRVLLHGGHLILTIPNNERLEESNVYCPACGAEFHRWGHVQTFTRASITKRLNDNGFKVITVRALPLGLMAEHFLIRYCWKWFIRVGFCKASDLFVVGEKV